MNAATVRLLLLLSAILTIFIAGAAVQETAAQDKKSLRKQTRQLLKTARIHIDSADYQAAGVALDSVLLLDDANADGYFYQGLVSIHSGDTSRGLSILAQGVAKCPLSSRLKLLLARLKIGGGFLDEAEELVDGVLAVKPRQGEALYLKGSAMLQRGDTAGAMVLFEKALEISRELANK